MARVRAIASYSAVLLTSIAWIAFCLYGVFWLLYGIPELAYKVRSPGLSSECERVRPGMNLEQVLQIFDAAVPPQEEDYQANEAHFSRENGRCTVTFEPSMELVIGAHVEYDFPRFETSSK